MDKTIPEAVAEKIEAVLYRVYMDHPDSRLTTTMIRDMAAAVVQFLARQPTTDGCHCRTCTCNPNMTPAVRFDLSPAQKEGAIREHLIRLGWTPPREVE